MTQSKDSFLFVLAALISFMLPIASPAAEDDRSEMIAEIPGPVLYISREQYIPDHHNTATLFQRGEINADNFCGGGSMKVWFPQTDEVKTLVVMPEGIIRDPAISFDASHVLFSFRTSKSGSYHIGELELNLTAETAPITITETTDLTSLPGFRQLTSMPGVSDIDPIYLPDGRIVFSSTRNPKYCMCNRHIMGNLYVMNADGSNIEQIGKNTLFEGHPSLLSDGRILYDRWEYVDRNFGDAQGLWVANPDGTKHEIFWGNNSAVPGGVIDARVLPGSDSICICTFTSCHDRAWGAIALVDRRLGVDGKDSVLMTWPAETRDWIRSEPHPGDPIIPLNQYDTFGGSPRKYEDPFPITDDFFLAAGVVEREQTGIWGLDTDGRSLLLHNDPESCYDPMPIIPTAKPPVIGNRVDRSKSTGTFVVSNVYEGFGMKDVPLGSVKYLRVVESPEKWTWTREKWSTTGEQAPAMAWDDFNNKRILGTVPVSEDGSAAFEVPAERFVYFQLLDENKMMIQSMRSGIMVRPGETNACVGCHEDRIGAPASSGLSVSSIAGKVRQLEPWYGPERNFSYLEEVQPVFDKYCVACHDYGKPAEPRLNLARDRNPVFNTSYVQLRQGGFVRVPGAGPHNTLPPYEWGSTASRLGRVLLTGHPDPQIDKQRKEMGLCFDRQTDPESFDRIITWIDINAPYYPYYGSSYRSNNYARSPISSGLFEELQKLTGLNAQNLTLNISFDRPEQSPALAHLAPSSENPTPSSEYKRALEILEIGRTALQTQDRGESTGWEPTDPFEIAMKKRSEWFADREQRVRRAILNGEKLYDSDFGAPPSAVAISDEETTAIPRSKLSHSIPIPAGKEAGDLLEKEVNGITLRFRWCPAGRFMMGSPEDEPGHNSDEQLREITITRGFWMLETEVQQSIWAAVMPDLPHPGYFAGGNHPVDWVSWRECRDFCYALSQEIGGVVRLPSETEWEYACRAGSTGPISGTGNIGDMGLTRQNGRFAHDESGKFQPNAWGIVDMHGNVWEWCDNLFDGTDGSRVIRGGSSLCDPRQCRSAYRVPGAPEIGFYNLGLRILLEAD